MDTIGNRLKAAREEAGLTKAQLQRRCGMKSSSTLTELEMDLHPKSAQLPRIAHELGVNAMWLIEGKGQKYAGQVTGPTLVTTRPPVHIVESEMRLAAAIHALITAYTEASDYGREQMLETAMLVEKKPKSGLRSTVGE